MKVHFILHESFEAPAAIETWAQQSGHATSCSRLYAGDSFPPRLDFDLLVIMGGPQCPATTLEECSHIDAKKEIAFIQNAIAQDKLLLGVCLGAQLIGQALDAPFDHSPQREIGVFPITLTTDGKQDPNFRNFPGKFSVGHWHGDMPGLTPEAKVLAVSDGCPRQIVRYAPSIYGFQCHFEFTSEAAEEMIQNNAAELEQYKGLPYIQTAHQLRSEDYREMNKMLFSFLDRLCELPPTRRR